MRHDLLVGASSVALLLLAAGTASAGDGRLEINQACVATGCFPGDNPGFPVETLTGKSYVLTSSLTVPDINTVGVSLDDRSVLDLNGFEIAGPTTCSGAPATCSAAGTGIGVYAKAHSTVRNGTIRGMGGRGIGAAVGVTIENVLVQGNASTGIQLNYGGDDGPEAHLIRASRVVGNGGVGIANSFGTGGMGTLITDCVIHGNANEGLYVNKTLVTNNTIARNGGVGITGVDVAFGGNSLTFNNGGNDKPQTGFGLTPIGTNFCGTDTVCP